MHPYLFPGLEASPRIIADIVRRIPVEKMDAPTHPNRFTPREVVAHMADWEPIFLERMRVTAHQPGSTIHGIDETQRAVDMGYSEWDWERQLELIAKHRADSIAFLKGLSPDQFGLHSVHNEKGALTIDDQANMLMGHDLYHIDQLLNVL